MKFDVKVNKLKLKLVPIPKINKALAKAGLKAKQIILERTDSGKFLGGKYANKPYSKSYWKFKSKKHSNPTVNLQYTNQMLNSMQTRQVANRRAMYAEVYFSNKEANKKAYWNNQTRRFFDLTDRELATVQNVFKRFIDA